MMCHYDVSALMQCFSLQTRYRVVVEVSVASVRWHFSGLQRLYFFSVTLAIKFSANEMNMNVSLIGNALSQTQSRIDINDSKVLGIYVNNCHNFIHPLSCSKLMTRLIELLWYCLLGDRCYYILTLTVHTPLFIGCCMAAGLSVDHVK